MDVLHPICVVEPPKEVGGVGMTERTVPLAETVRQTGPHIDFNHLKGFGQQIAEHGVKGVCAGDVVERDVGEKDVPLLFKRQAVAAEPIVIDVCEKSLGGGCVGNGQATLNQSGDLVRIRQPGLRVERQLWGDCWFMPQPPLAEVDKRNKKTRP
jgi:hypothetical protein